MLLATARGVRAWHLHQTLPQHTLGAVGTKKSISHGPLLLDQVPPSSSERVIQHRGGVCSRGFCKYSFACLALLGSPAVLPSAASRPPWPQTSALNTALDQ